MTEAKHMSDTGRKPGGEATPRGRGRRRLMACGAIAAALPLLLIALAWLGLRRPWKHDPLAVGAFEQLIEAQGFLFEDTDKGDGLEGYALRRQGRGQWAERIYVDPSTGAQTELTRGFWHGRLQNSCTVTSRNAGGREALVRVAGEFSPYLSRRIARAEEQYARTGIWVRVTAPDFDIAVTPDSLSIDSRPAEQVGPIPVVRPVVYLFWRLSRLAGYGPGGR